MKKYLSLLIVALVFIAACGKSSGKTLVEINGDKITEGDLKFLGEINPRLQPQLSDPTGQKRILESLVEYELLYQEALKQGLQRDSKIKAKLELSRRVLIAQSLVEDEADKIVKKYYDEHAEEFKKLKFSHIMIKFATPEEIKKAKKGEKVRTEEEALQAANEIKAKLDSGEDFSKLANEYSDDATNKTRGGDLGLVSKGDKRMEGRGLASLVDKAFEMKVGETTGPIKTDKGYHIITLTRGIEVEPFNEAKRALLFKMGNETKQGLIDRLKKNSKIVYLEEEKAKAAAKKTSPQKEAEKTAPQTIAPDSQPVAPDQKQTGTLKQAEGDLKKVEGDLKKVEQDLKKSEAATRQLARDVKVETKDEVNRAKTQDKKTGEKK